MSEQELRELDAWIAEYVMMWQRREHLRDVAGSDFFYRSDKVFVQERGNHLKYFHPTDDPADTLEVLKKCFERDRNSCLASLHNFLMRKDHDGTLDETQICLFAKKLFSKCS